MSVRLRPRNAWEALDLGFALARDHAKRVYATWLAAYAPTAAILIAIFGDHPLYAWLVLWWLKPLFDRAVLEVLSGEIFEVHVAPGTLLRRLPGIAWRSGIVAALLWRRFDLARSMHLAVYQLERLSGAAARARMRVLDRDGRGAAVGMMAMMGTMELIFSAGAAMAIAVLVDVQTPVGTLVEGWLQGGAAGGLSTRYGVILAALSTTAIEPLYVACGFTLYLQRRTTLEGWDIELRFRQLAGRSEESSRPLAACAVLVGLWVAIALALAAAPAPARANAPRVEREVRAVLSDPEFGHERKRPSLTYVGPTWSPGPSNPGKPWDWSWLADLQRMIANGTRAAAWAAAIIAAVIALYYIARYARRRGLGAGERERPKFLFGLDVRPESLPDDVPAAAASLVDGGRLREALSLLYRASLVRFMDEGLELAQGDTEGDCMRRVSAAVAAQRLRYFERLVSRWQQLAYGHRPVPPAEARALALDWPAAFPPAPGSAPAPRPA